MRSGADLSDETKPCKTRECTFQATVTRCAGSPAEGVVVLYYSRPPNASADMPEPYVRLSFQDCALRKIEVMRSTFVLGTVHDGTEIVASRQVFRSYVTPQLFCMLQGRPEKPEKCAPEAKEPAEPAPKPEAPLEFEPVPFRPRTGAHSRIDGNTPVEGPASAEIMCFSADPASQAECCARSPGTAPVAAVRGTRGIRWIRAVVRRLCASARSAVRAPRVRRPGVAPDTTPT